MYAIVHQMRARIMTSPAFNGQRILAAILFENTMDRDVESQPTADYRWNVKQFVPVLKVDKGLAAEKDGAQRSGACLGISVVAIQLSLRRDKPDGSVAAAANQFARPMVLMRAQRYSEFMRAI